MLLRLHYSPTHPSLAFDLTLPDPPSNLPYPLGYILQLHRTSSHGLDLPSSIHALDKATWHNSLLKEVVFDLVSEPEFMMVSCVFIDGSKICWALESEARGMLDRVVEDVKNANEVVEKSYYWEPVVEQKHKRQKSILKTLLSSLVHPDRGFTSRKTITAPLSLTQLQKIRDDTSHTALFYRKRARSTLIDAFRRYILAHLRQQQCMLDDGYFSWMVRSMIKRTEAKMEEIVKSAKSVDLGLMSLDMDLNLSEGLNCVHSKEGRCFLMCGECDDDSEQTLSFDENDIGIDGDGDVDVGSLIEDDGDDEDEDDGLSLRTPRESIVDRRNLWGVDEEDEDDDDEEERRSSKESAESDIDIPIPIRINGSNNSSTQPQLDTQSQLLPRSPSPPTSQTHSTQHTLTHLRTLQTHLRTLHTHLQSTTQSTTHSKLDHEEAMASFEVKSRRRAWSMGVYLGGRGRGGRDVVGLGVCFVGSPLGRGGWCVDDCKEFEDGAGGEELKGKVEEEEVGDDDDDDAFTVVDVDVNAHNDDLAINDSNDFAFSFNCDCDCDCRSDYGCEEEDEFEDPDLDLDMGIFRFSPYDDNEMPVDSQMESGRESRMLNHPHYHSRPHIYSRRHAHSCSHSRTGTHSRMHSRLYPSAADYPRPVARRGEYPSPNLKSDSNSDANLNVNSDLDSNHESSSQSQSQCQLQSQSPTQTQTHSQSQPQTQTQSQIQPQSIPSLPLPLTPIPIHIFRRRHQNHQNRQANYDFEFADLEMELELGLGYELGSDGRVNHTNSISNTNTNRANGGGVGGGIKLDLEFDSEPDGLEFRFVSAAQTGSRRGELNVHGKKKEKEKMGGVIGNRKGFGNVVIGEKMKTKTTKKARTLAMVSSITSSLGTGRWSS